MPRKKKTELEIQSPVSGEDPQPQPQPQPEPERELEFESEVYPRYFPAVQAVARQFLQAARANLWSVEDDDALQIARTALWKAWLRDKTCKRGFTELAKTITKRRLINWLRREVPIMRGAGGGDGGPPAQVYSLDGLQERDPETWENKIRPMNEFADEKTAPGGKNRERRRKSSRRTET